MKKLIILPLIIATVYSVNASAQQLLPASLIATKALQWSRQNLSFSGPFIGKAEDVKLSDQQLFFEIVRVIEEEEPFGNRASSIMETLISNNLALAQSESNYIESLIDNLDMHESDKLHLKDILAGVATTNISTHPDLSTREDQVPIGEILDQGIESLVRAPIPWILKSPLVRTLETVKDVLVKNIDDDDCYQYDPSCQFDSNKGIIHYFSNRIHQSHNLALATLRYSIRVAHLNRRYEKILEDPPTYNQVFDLDLWPIILDSSQQNPALALEVMSIYGHDVCCNRLYLKSENQYLTSILNEIRPSGYGADENPESVHFLPGVIKGVVPKRLAIRNMTEAIEEYEKYHDEEVFLRNGYHHFYGGVLITQALLANDISNIGLLDLSTLTSQAMGYFYKRLQMYRYLSDEAIQLWEEGFQKNEHKKDIPKPEDWSDEQYLRVKSEVQLHIAITHYTEDQHRAGARFARRIYNGNY